MHVTDIEGNDAHLIIYDEQSNIVLTEDAVVALRSGRPGCIDAGGRRYFMNVYLPSVQIVIIGAVHIGQILSQMAALAGFDVRVIDPRAAFATCDRFNGFDLVPDWPVDALKGRPLDGYTALVAVTHDPKIDDFPVAEALRAGCFYVGALGSHKTHASRLERSKAEGFGEVECARIRAPIGLAIGAFNPAEIAIAILAEITTDAFFAKILLGALGRVEMNNNSGNIMIDSPGAIQANTVQVRSPGKTVKIQPASGTIGADQDASRYVQYLINRYNEFAAADKSRPTKFSYGAISKNIETNFRAPWKLLAMEDFDGVCTYLQARISRTRIAKSNLVKGTKSFSSYEAFLESGRR